MSLKDERVDFSHPLAFRSFFLPPLLFTLSFENTTTASGNRGSDTAEIP
jgi:hypothetical protein